MGNKSTIVRIQDFHAKKLDNNRDIFIYLPEGYEGGSETHYPVLYMNDGQNIFSISNKSLSGSSWNADLTVDQLIEHGRIKKIIIVGISNNTSRSGEYTHYSCFDKTVNGGALGEYKISVEAKGELYEDFIINDLKPFIDSNYRTLAGPENTAMIGSSMGGLVTYNIGFRHPDIFGFLGILSPAFFWEEQDTLSTVQKGPLKIWMDVGEGEDHFVTHARKVVEILLKKGYRSGEDFMYFQEPWAVHSEADWGKRLFMPLLYFFGEIGNPVSCQLTGPDCTDTKSGRFYVNPVITYDSGFQFSQVQGSYSADHPEVLEVSGDGTMTGKTVGTASVTFSWNKIRACREYSVVRELSDMVSVGISVNVPANTPQDARIYMGTYVTMPLELVRSKERMYRGTFTFPRNLTVCFRFRREADVFGKPDLTVEKDRDGKNAEIRKFQVSDENEFVYTVEKWGDIL